MLPGGYEDPANPVILDDSPHGSDSLPLSGVVGVVVLGQLTGQAVDAGHCSPIAQVGHDHLAVFDENTGGCNGPNIKYMSVVCTMYYVVHFTLYTINIYRLEVIILHARSQDKQISTSSTNYNCDKVDIICS